MTESTLGNPNVSVRRWFKMALDPNGVSPWWSSKASADLAGARADVIYVGMAHKAAYFQNLYYGAGGDPSFAFSIQNVKLDPSTYVDPAPDCLSAHFPTGYVPYGAQSPLTVFLFTGFPTPFGTFTLPPLLQRSYDRPVDYNF